MKWRDCDRLESLLKVLESGDKLSGKEQLEVLRILMQESIARFYSNLES
jgi:hypothetical protein